MSEFVYEYQAYTFSNSSPDKLIKHSCIILYSCKYSMALSRLKLLKEYVRNDTTGKSQLWNTPDAKQAGLIQ
jgi:hypothetical protein